MEHFWEIILTPAFAHSIFRISTSLIYAGMAAVISERAGVTNIGIEGIMLIASLAAVLFSAATQSALVGLLGAVVMGVVIALIMAYFILQLKTHNVMSGLSINMLAKGVTVFALFVATGQKGASTSLKSVSLPRLDLPFLRDIPILGEILSGQNVLTYLSIFLVASMWVLLYKTRLGVHIRAVGETPSAAVSVGVKLKRVQYIALAVSGAFAGLAGAYLSLGYMDGFTTGMTAGRGFIALAACSMGAVTPWGTTVAAIFFGAADALANSLQMLGIPAQFVQMIPYAATLLGITLYAIRKGALRKKAALHA